MIRETVLAGFLLAFGCGAAAAVDEMALKQEEANAGPSARAPLVLADTESYSGDNTTGTEWARPFADGTCCSGLGPVRFVTEIFTVSQNDTCDVGSVQDGWDGYLFIYTSPFDPSAQTVNFVAGDDDGNGGIGTSDIESINLMAGTTYTLVTTGFANGDVGTFTNTVSCPTANVTIGAGIPVLPVARLVPASDYWSLVLLGFALALGSIAVLRGRNG
jgi:hypothetical protein